MNYYIREAAEGDVSDICRIYNSNPKFLIHHLGVKQVEESFIRNEMQEMKLARFLSSVIVKKDSDELIGVIDYQPTNQVYLSLMMLGADMQGNGMGTSVYRYFEKMMITAGNSSIRIDVVNDYIGNVVGFWEGLGFVQKEEIALTWGEKSSRAVVMIKELRSQG